MNMQLVTGNHAAGHSLGLAGEANRNARGAVCGIYPITPQTEIVEYVAKFPFTRGSVVPVESEHSAMAVSMGAAINGARSFTASSANGLAYMAENIMVAGYYRLPIVMVAVNRTLGPPWNIWADQGDTLALRDFAWLQFYCETNQEVLDTTLLAFRIAEDRRILLPVMICMDAFIVSHTHWDREWYRAFHDFRGDLTRIVRDVLDRLEGDGAYRHFVLDGQTVVLGGIYETERRETISKVPFLGDIPAVGVLFRSKQLQNDKSELLIFVTPRILEEGSTIY